MNTILESTLKGIKVSLSNHGCKDVLDLTFALEDMVKLYDKESYIADFYKQLDDLVIDIEVSITTNIKNGNSKGVKLLTQSLKIIKGLMYDIEINYYDKLNNKTNKAEKLLTWSTENSVLMCTYNENSRGIGKSTELLKLANKLDITLVTNHHYKKGCLDDIAQKLQIPVDVRYFTSPDSVRGARMKNNKFLVDEGVTKEVIDQLLKRGNELVGGFVSLHTLENKGCKKESKNLGFVEVVDENKEWNIYYKGNKAEINIEDITLMNVDKDKKHPIKILFSADEKLVKVIPLSEYDTNNLYELKINTSSIDYHKPFIIK